MRRLHTKVNLIPVIAKADTMTDDEVAAFKARILADIHHQGIEIFQAPKYDQEDEETTVENEEIMVRPLLTPRSNPYANPPLARSARSPLPSSVPT